MWGQQLHNTFSALHGSVIMLYSWLAHLDFGRYIQAVIRYPRVWVPFVEVSVNVGLGHDITIDGAKVSSHFGCSHWVQGWDDKAVKLCYAGWDGLKQRNTE